MLVFIVTPGHQRAVKALADRSYWADMPEVELIDYYQLLGAREARSATYVFADLERLQPWELRFAGLLRRNLMEAGLKCVNDPAMAMGRFELLRALNARGVNPYAAYLAINFPRPRQFPVFVRREDDHGSVDELVVDQKRLDTLLRVTRQRGIGLRGLLVVEYCAEPIDDNLWRKLATFRIGDRYSLDHHVVQDDWRVKYGREGLEHPPGRIERLLQEEFDDVTQNRVPDPVKAAFEIARIEFGRADHAVVDGRTVIYEINTNPHLRPRAEQRWPLRNQTVTAAHGRLAEMLWSIDSGDGRVLDLAPGRRIPVEWLGEDQTGPIPVRP